MNEGLHQTHKLERMPEVVLHFMRHSIKEKAPEKADNDVLLTTEGRVKAADKFDEPMNLRFGHVKGTERVRTQETGAAAATKDPNASQEDLGVGKIRVVDELNFQLDEITPYGAAFYKVFNAGVPLPWLIHDSDKLAKETGDTYQSTYSRMAGNIASLIQTTYLSASRGARILEQSDNGTNTANDFERILVTHGTVPESFLLKLAYKVQGEDAQNKLLETLGSGFAVTEGFDVKLSKEGGEEKIHVTYKKGDYTFDAIVPPAVLQEIVDEGRA